MRGIWEEILGQEAKTKDKPNTSEPEMEIDQILTMRLSELSKRDIAIKIYSGVLDCEVWLYSNEKMASQIKEDDPDVVTYTVDEMRQLIKSAPSPEDLRAIQNVKSVFPGSKIIDSGLKETSDEPDRT